MISCYERNGTVTIKYMPQNGDMLLSPDKTQQYLPCESCGSLQWVATNVVSFICCDESSL